MAAVILYTMFSILDSNLEYHPGSAPTLVNAVRCVVRIVNIFFCY